LEIVVVRVKGQIAAHPSVDLHGISGTINDLIVKYGVGPRPERFPVYPGEITDIATQARAVGAFQQEDGPVGVSRILGLPEALPPEGVDSASDIGDGGCRLIGLSPSPNV